MAFACVMRDACRAGVRARHPSSPRARRTRRPRAAAASSSMDCEPAAPHRWDACRVCCVLSCLRPAVPAHACWPAPCARASVCARLSAGPNVPEEPLLSPRAHHFCGLPFRVQRACHRGVVTALHTCSQRRCAFYRHSRGRATAKPRSGSVLSLRGWRRCRRRRQRSLSKAAHIRSREWCGTKQRGSSGQVLACWRA